MPSSPAADPVVVCPACRSALAAASISDLTCTGCGLHYPVTDGIPNLLTPRTAAGLDVGTTRWAAAADIITHFEETYRRNEEPWDYTARAGEVLRHDYTCDLAAQLKPRYERILDIGCSLGQLTGRMYGLAQHIHGIDVSPVAVAKARAHCRRVAENGAASSQRPASEYHFYVGSGVDVPVRDSSCDLILLCDGLRSWQLDAAQREAILEGVNRALMPGGYAILTDYLKTPLFETFLGWIRQSPLQISYVDYLPDRQWYQFASWFNGVRDAAPVRRMLASRRLARAIMAGSRGLGRYGSAHMCVVATKGTPAGTA